MPVFPTQDAQQGSPFGARRIDVAQVMTQQTQRVMAAAVAHASTQGHAELDALHLLWALAGEEPTRTLLQRTGADPDAVREAVAQQLPTVQEGSTVGSAASTMSAAAQSALADAYRVARALGSTYIAPEHLLLALTQPDHLRRSAARGPRRHRGVSAAHRGRPAGRGRRQRHPDPGPVRYRPHRPRPRREDRPRHRPGRGDRAGHRGPGAPHQEQPRARR